MSVCVTETRYPARLNGGEESSIEMLIFPPILFNCVEIKLNLMNESDENGRREKHSDRWATSLSKITISNFIILSSRSWHARLNIYEYFLPAANCVGSHVTANEVSHKAILLRYNFSPHSFGLASSTLTAPARARPLLRRILRQTLNHIVGENEC